MRLMLCCAGLLLSLSLLGCEQEKREPVGFKNPAIPVAKSAPMADYHWGDNKILEDVPAESFILADFFERGACSASDFAPFNPKTGNCEIRVVLRGKGFHCHISRSVSGKLILCSYKPKPDSAVTGARPGHDAQSTLNANFAYGCCASCDNPCVDGEPEPDVQPSIVGEEFDVDPFWPRRLDLQRTTLTAMIEEIPENVIAK